VTEIYEIVDATNDEIYYPMGFFLKEANAIKALKDLIKHNTDNPITEYADEYEKIEIRNHFGNELFPNTKVVYTLERVAKWDEESEELKWSIINDI